jgi:hypothetical protein
MARGRTPSASAISSRVFFAASRIGSMSSLYRMGTALAENFLSAKISVDDPFACGMIAKSSYSTGVIDMLATIIAYTAVASLSASVGYVFCTFTLVVDRNNLIGSLRHDLLCQSEVISSYKTELEDANDSISEKNELIRTLDAEAESYVETIIKWVPSRDARGHFVKKVR